MSSMMKSRERSYLGPRQVRPMAMTPEDVEDYMALASLGIGISPSQVNQMLEFAAEFAMDDQQGLTTTASISTPVQFLQAWLPGFVRTITAARKIDELVGITTVGEWEDEEVVQGILEPVGSAVPYGDYTQVPFASWNNNWERRTVVRFEKGFQIGQLEERRAARMRVNTSAEKRAQASLSLEIERNLVGFNGYNSGNNRTYGYLNDPALPAYVNVPNGAAASPLWANKTFIEITADIRAAAVALQTQSQDTVNPITDATTLGIATAAVGYLSTTPVYGNGSVMEWIAKTYPKMRVVSAPQLNAANGGANVFYLHAEDVNDGASDDGRVFNQVVPAKFMALGVEKRSKAYLEDFANATAGVMLKRPYAVVRRSGI